MNFEVVASPVVIKQGMLDEVYEKANNLGMMMAKKLNSDNSK